MKSWMAGLPETPLRHTCLECAIEFETYFARQVRCLDCVDSTTRFQAEMAEEELLRSREEDNARWKAFRDNPATYWEGSRELDWIPPKHRGGLTGISPSAEIVNWSGEPWSVTFQGSNGRGKSWAAARTLTEALINRRSKSLAWWRCGELIAAHKRAFNEGGTEVIAKSLRADVVVMDDLRAVRETDFSADVLREALMYREEWLLPTIVTLDVPLSKVEPRLESRLRGGIVVSMTGEDLRRNR